MSTFFNKRTTVSNNGHFGIEAYTNTDRTDSLSDRRPQSGSCSCTSGNLVTWRIRKLGVIG